MEGDQQEAQDPLTETSPTSGHGYLTSGDPITGTFHLEGVFHVYPTVSEPTAGTFHHEGVFHAYFTFGGAFGGDLYLGDYFVVYSISGDSIADFFTTSAMGTE